MIAAKDDKALLKLFHSYPLTGTILNIIVTAVFITSFVTSFWLLLAGAALVIMLQFYFPDNGRVKIAELFKSKYKTASDTQPSPFFYLVRREIAINGNYTEKKSEKIFRYVYFAFRIVNYFFNLLAALMCTALTGAVALIFGGAIYLLAIFANKSGLIEVSKMLAGPFKWTISVFLKNALIPGSIEESDIAKKYAAHGKPSAVQQDLSFENYFSIGTLTLPSAHASLSASFHGTLVTVSGNVHADKMVYSNNSNLYDLQRTVKDLLEERLSEACKRFYSDCPDASGAKLDIDIDYVLD